MIIKDKRLRRARKTRARIRSQSPQNKRPWVCVDRSLKHITGQLLVEKEGHQIYVLTAASTKEKALRDKVKGKTGCEAAKIIGLELAQRARKEKVEKIAFDRSGFKYHGRVKAMVEGLREGGMDF